MALTTEQFAAGVENVGATLVAFNQTDRFGNRAYMNRGACRALSIVWIRNEKLKSTAQDLPGATQQVEDVSWLAEQQHKGKALDITDPYLRTYGLAPDGSIFFGRGVDWLKLWTFLAAKNGYFLVGMDNPNGGSGHEIAFCTANTFKMFDPNYGTVTFPDMPTLKRFFELYRARAYPELMLGTASINRYV